MRMSKDSGLSACDVVNDFSEDELVKIFFEYGEEKFSRMVARNIVAKRKDGVIDTTNKLKEIVDISIPTWKKRESESRIFQALRIFVNDELLVLQKALEKASSMLNIGGRIIVLSYHSLEDRIVKREFNRLKESGSFAKITKKPVQATEEEIALNSRARSAKLRVIEKRE